MNQAYAPMGQVTHVFQVFSINTKMNFNCTLTVLMPIGRHSTTLFPRYSHLKFCDYGPALE